jgi:hypothetical protein
MTLVRGQGGNNISGTVSQGSYEYGHAGAADTLVTAGTFYELTNDSAGASTINTYGVTGLTDIYDSVTNRFTFSSDGVLSLGDSVHIVVEAAITTPGANTQVEIVIELGAQGSGDYIIIMEPTTFKSSGTYDVSRTINFFMRTSDILDNGARVLAKSDANNTDILVDDYIISAYHTNAEDEQ